MKNQYIVSEPNKKKREEFFDYINNEYNLDICYPYTKEEFIKSNFPFVIDFKEKNFWICDSITCCACAAQAKQIIGIKEFKNINNESTNTNRRRKNK